MITSQGENKLPCRLSHREQWQESDNHPAYFVSAIL